MTPEQIESRYNALSKSWRSLTRSDKSIAVSELQGLESEVRRSGDRDLAAALHMLAGRIQIELDGSLPVPDEDLGLP